MKKLTSLGLTIISFLAPLQVLAQSPTSVIVVKRPTGGFASIGNFISNAVTVALAAAIIIVLLMLIIGAFEWITSGGDKENVAKARNRILNALIGLAILAVAFALANFGARFAGFDIFNITVPVPDTSPPPSGQL